MVKTKTVFLAAAVNKAVQDGVSQAAIDRVLGEDPEGKTPEELRGNMGERRRGGGHQEEGKKCNMFADIAKGGSLLEGGSPNREERSTRR